MNSMYVLMPALVAIGIVAGLRALTPPAVVAWAAFLGWLHVTAPGHRGWPTRSPSRF